MARKRASMREGPLAELFRATEAAQRQAEHAGNEGEEQPAAAPEPEPFTPEPEPELPPAAIAPPEPAPTAPPVAEAPSRHSELLVDERATRWIEPLPEQPPRLWTA